MKVMLDILYYLGIPILIIFVVVLLTGCNGTLPNVPVTTDRAVGIPCLKKEDVPARPNFVTDAQLAAKNDDAIVYSLGEDRLARQDYEGLLEATIAGCVGSKPIPKEVEIPKESAPDKPWWQFWK